MSWLPQIALGSLISAVIGGLIVAVASHLFTLREDRARKLSNTRVEMLMDAWKKIEAASNIDNWKGRARSQIYLDLEDAYASIMLLGTDSQMMTAKQFAQEVGRGPGASSLDLLNILRVDLRKELGLSVAKEDYIFLRMKVD